MLRTLVWVGPALLATALAAQEKPKEATAPAPKGAATAAERYTELQADQKKLADEYQARIKEYSAKAKEAKAENKPAPALPTRPDNAALIERAQAAAKDFAGSDDAVQFLVFIVRNGSGNKDAIGAAFTTLAEKHVDSDALTPIASSIGSLPRLIGKEQAEPVLDRFAKSANPDVRGYLALFRCQEAIDEADLKGDAYKTAKAQLQKAAEAAKDASLKKRIADTIEIREKYGAGNVATEIAAEDLDGVAFKLSDYKGKVVFLDFWGDW